MATDHLLGWLALALGISGVCFVAAPVTFFAFPLALGAASALLGIAYLVEQDAWRAGVWFPALLLAIASIAIGIVGMGDLEDVRSVLDVV